MTRPDNEQISNLKAAIIALLLIVWLLAFGVAA
jgi:hypothetical protein